MGPTTQTRPRVPATGAPTGINPIRSRTGRGRPPRRDADAIIHALAGKQHGVVSRSQLLQAGLPPYLIEYRVKSGTLTPIHRGVYQAGLVLAPLGDAMAAILAAGPGALLSHLSAGREWEILPDSTDTSPITVSSRRDLRGRLRGVRHHQISRIDADEITFLDGLPITTPSRTLLDLAGHLRTAELRVALALADRTGRLDSAELEILLDRYPNRRGNSRLRTLLAAQIATLP